MTTSRLSYCFAAMSIGCTSTTTPRKLWTLAPPNPLRADHVAAVDFDGDGSDAIVTVVNGQLDLGHRSVELPGDWQAAVRRPSGSGDSLLIATGEGRLNRSAAVTLTEVRADNEREIWRRDGDRDQTTDLRFVNEKTWIAVYADSKAVSGGWLTEDSPDWRTKVHMGQRQAPLQDGRVVVGRVYGEEPRSHGDLRIVGDGPDRVLPGLRGVRALAVADLDGDGDEDIVAGDGWHFAYGKEADARVVLYKGPAFETARVIGWVPDSYAALDIQVIGSGEDAALVVLGSHRVVLFARDALGWAPYLLGPATELSDIAVAREGSAFRVAASGPNGWTRTVSLSSEKH